MIRILIILILVILISGCIDEISVRDTIKNSSTNVIQYAENVSVPDPCLKIDNNTTCISDINISVKIDK